MTKDEVYEAIRALPVDQAGDLYRLIAAEFLQIAHGQLNCLASTVATLLGVTGTYVVLSQDGRATWHLACIDDRPDSAVTNELLQRVQGAVEVMFQGTVATSAAGDN